MLGAIANSQSDLASSDDMEDGIDKNDDDADPELGKLSKDDEPGQVIATITKTVQNHMLSFWQKQIALDEPTQTEWWDMAVEFPERFAVQDGRMEGSSSCDTPNRHYCSHTISYNICTANDEIDVICGQSQMPQVTSRTGSGQMRLGS